MILAIIQARVGGERLPGKVLEEIEGTPMIEHVINRVVAAELIDKVCVAIPDGEADDVLASVIVNNGNPVGVKRGSEDDVLGRFYWTAEMYPEAQPIVRITADDCFKDPALIDYAVQAFLTAWAEPHEMAGSPHYLHLGGKTWPLGLDVEVFSREALTLAFQGASSAEHREHVTSWMREGIWWELKNPREHGDVTMRWTVDTPEDLAFARSVYGRLYESDPLFGYEAMQGAGY